MAIGFVGKGLGMMAAVVPLGVVTPPAFFDAGDTYRLTTETGDAIKTASGDYLERHFYSLATAAGDRLLTEDSQLLEV